MRTPRGRGVRPELVALCCMYWLLCCATAAMGQDVTIMKNTLFGRLGEAQVELTGPDGVHILIDVADPDSLSCVPTERDILVTTHLHYDHIKKYFADSFPGQQIRMERGEITRPGLRIRSIIASHNAYPPSHVLGGDDFIIVIDWGSLRIVHFGDFEQTEFTADQLAELADVDIAFVPLYNPVIGRAVEQAKPRLLIPTHMSNSSGMKELVQRWPVREVEQDWVRLAKGDVPVDTTLLLVGDWARRFAGIFRLDR